MDDALAHVRAEARLSAPLDRAKPELGTLRQHYERMEWRGGAIGRTARKKLRVPPCPEAAEHLVSWTYQLYGRDGFNMGGPNLLSNREADRFFALRRIVPDPLEIDGLFMLNAAYCHPDDEDERADEREGVPRETTLPPMQRGREMVTVDGKPLEQA